MPHHHQRRHHHHHGWQSIPLVTVNGLEEGARVSPGSLLTIIASNGPANRTDWVGIAAAGQDPSVDIPDFVYLVTGTTERPPAGMPGVTGATITSLSAPAASGNYEARFYGDDGVTSAWMIAAAPFSVSN